MSGVQDYLSRQLKALTPEKWDGFVRWLDGRMSGIEEQVSVQQQVADSILARGLQVIEDGIGPSIVRANEAADEIAEIADLGMVFSAPSPSTITIDGGAEKTFTIAEDRRAQFAPANYVMAYVEGDFANAIIGSVASYNRQTGALVVTVDDTRGAGTFTDWMIGPAATTDDLEALRDTVEGWKDETRDARLDALGSRNAAAASATSAAGSATSAGDTLSAFQAIWYGARVTAPPGAAIGSQFLDTSQTPNVVKVLTETGWSPTVTISVGGIREQDYGPADGGETGPFTVDGGFKTGDVYLNGTLLRDGVDVTFDEGAGNFSLAAGLASGDVLAFRGYQANDLTDIFTKAEVKARGVGVIIDWSLDILPDHLAELDGALFDRAAFPELWGIVETYGGDLLVDEADWVPGQLLWSRGDGSTTFRLPDVRSLFGRAADSGAGRDPGRGLGTYQDSENKTHTHTGSTVAAGNHAHAGSTSTNGWHGHSGSTSASGQHAHSMNTRGPYAPASGNTTYGVNPSWTGITTGGNAAGNHSHTFTTAGAGNHTHTFSTNTTGSHSHSFITAGSGGDESRPANYASRRCVVIQ